MAKKPQKILVIRLSSIGDVILTSPLLRLLRQHFPAAIIGFAVKKQFADLLRNNPNVDLIFSLDTEKGFQALKELKKKIRVHQFDMILDLHTNFRSYYLRWHQNALVNSYAKMRFKRFMLVKFGLRFYHDSVPVYKRYIRTVAKYGISDDGLGLEFYLDSEILASINLKYGHILNSGKPLIAFAPGAGFKTKRWLPEYFAKLAKDFINNKALLIFAGDEGDKKLVEEITDGLPPAFFINAAGELTLMETACLLDHIDLMITNDTGLMHMAIALKKRTVAIFGSTTRELGFAPVENFARIIENENLSCRPCSHIGRQNCPKGHFKCMKEILPGQVYTVASELLKQRTMNSEQFAMEN